MIDYRAHLVLKLDEKEVDDRFEGQPSYHYCGLEDEDTCGVT